MVFKVGGSLLNLPDLADRLRSVLLQRGSCRCAMVVGGGEVVDIVRSWSERFAMSEFTAHWVAIEALRTTATMIRALLPDAVLCDSAAECHSTWESGNLPVLDCLSFCRRDQLLPVGWHVTSDSIAARMAVTLEASELVLLKSVGVPATNRDEKNHPPHADAPVDPWFSLACADLPAVAWCNLRSPAPLLIEPWEATGHPLRDFC